MLRKQIVSERQLRDIDNYVGKVLDAYKNGAISRLEAVLDIGHVIVAIDQGNETEFVQYRANGPNKG